MSGPPERIETGCVVAGGGPAGMMAGLLMARAGVETIVLEKHADFLRDFRGDTIHPSTLTVLDELGALQRFLLRPHQKVPRIAIRLAGRDWPFAEFSRLRRHPPYVAMIPQWDFLDFLAEEASAFPAFRLMLSTPASGLLMRSDAVAGVRAEGSDGPIEVRARLVIAADGRHSRLRDAAELPVEDLGAPIDVLWMRLPRRPDDPAEPFAIPGVGGMLVMINRGDYWQSAYVIRKGGLEAMKAAGLDVFRQRIAGLAPFLAGRTDTLREWSDVKLLSVQVDRLKCWHRPGLLVIGDAAHAMSPVGGVGINLAIQDAVAAVNLLAVPLSCGRPDDAALASVQRRREWPTRMIQRAQIAAHERILFPLIRSETAPGVPLALRLLDLFPPLRYLPALAIGVGLRPEHVRSPREGPTGSVA